MQNIHHINFRGHPYCQSVLITQYQNFGKHVNSFDFSSVIETLIKAFQN